MKTFFLLFSLLAIMLAAYPFIKPSEDKGMVEGLPWQITVLNDGTTEVFGIHIGSSQLADAIEILGNDMDLAVIAASDETGSLEMYYGHYRAGLLSGKLVLQTDTPEQKIKSLREHAVSSEYMASGQAKKYTLSTDDLPLILEQRITGLTFIPTVNLDEAVILARFEEPEQRVQSGDVVHYLYPDKGLHIALSEHAKEVLQYVAPEHFQQLVQPLLK
ncbi:MAG TPA: hypothetical protein ENJ87_00515 [Gammaproteobacteria bacterium]|nr:hypothetical protein [Gammaproteobacteria bacterium]